MRARAIVMPLSVRPGSTVFDKTVETVLAERPCRVIIESDPDRVAREEPRPGPTRVASAQTMPAPREPTAAPPASCR